MKINHVIQINLKSKFKNTYPIAEAMVEVAGLATSPHVGVMAVTDRRGRAGVNDTSVSNFCYFITIHGCTI